MHQNLEVQRFRWNSEKNGALKSARGISFEDIVIAIESDGLVDVLAHPNPSRYPRQRILVVACDEYVYLVPFVDEGDHLFPKTVIPSRKATRDYLKQGDADADH